MGKLTDDDLHHGCSRGRPPPLLFFLSLLLLSLLLTLSCSLVSNVNGKEDEEERGLMGLVRWSADMWGQVVCVCDTATFACYRCQSNLMDSPPEVSDDLPVSDHV